MRDLKPELKVYSLDSLPAAYEHQIRSFIRIIWFDIYLYQVNPPLALDQLHPQYVVMVEGDILYSVTGVYWVSIEHQGQSYKLYGLGDVLTYPAFRKRGFGRAVVNKATEIARQDPAADLALLWTAQQNFAFYQQCGWEMMPDVTVLHGSADDPTVEEETPFMLFFSDKAKANRQHFLESPLYIGEERW